MLTTQLNIWTKPEYSQKYVKISTYYVKNTKKTTIISLLKYNYFGGNLHWNHDSNIRMFHVIIAMKKA